MQLRSYLGQIAEQSESVFQAQLAKEDLARVERLAQLAREAGSLEELQKEALYIGWTPGDLRTGELKEVLLPLITAMHAFVTAGESEGSDEDRELLEAWRRFHAKRIEVLIHCL